MSQRLNQISGHISNSYSRGLLAGEVAIITGKLYYRTSAFLALNENLPGAGQV